MYKIAVLGDRDSVMGFKALGLDTFFVEEAEEARHTLHRVAKEEYAIVYVTEQLAQLIPADIARYKTETTPAVILIPGKTGSLGLGAQALQTALLAFRLLDRRHRFLDDAGLLDRFDFFNGRFSRRRERVRRLFGRALLGFGWFGHCGLLRRAFRGQTLVVLRLRGLL